MWRKVLLTFLLLAFLTLPAFCGFGWVRNSSAGSLENSLTETESTTPVPTQSSSEEQSDGNPIEKPLKSSAESSATASEVYAEATADYGAKLEEAKASLKKDEQIALVDELITSKAVADEQFYILAEESEKKDEIITELQKKADGVNFALGFSVGYAYPSYISPGIDMQMRAGSWIMTAGVSYELDWEEGLRSQITSIDPTKIETRIGVLYEF